jgi:superfamily II DNA helicase RecQ
MLSSQGLNVPDLTVVVLFGVPQHLIDFCQKKKGRVGGASGSKAICLLIAEAWAWTWRIRGPELGNYKPGVEEQHTEPSIINYSSSSTCLRETVMTYSGEQGTQG